MAATLSKLSYTRLLAPLVVLLILYRLLRGYRETYESTFWTPTPSTDPSINHVALLSPGPALDTLCAHYRVEAYPDRYHRRKIYDLILINDELDWLLIRLGQMSSHVDYFVIGESPMTFSNQPKPLHIQENLRLFSSYAEKMIIHTLNETGQPWTVAEGEQSEADPWAREEFSRNSLFIQVFPTLTGEATPGYGDVIISGDVDELIRPSILTVLRQCSIPRHVRLHTKMYYYGFQWLQSGNGRGDWSHPDATTFVGFATGDGGTKTPQEMRVGGESMEIWEAGWHCSYCFATLRQTINKIKSYSHQEMNRPEILEPKGLVERIRIGKDLLMRGGEECHRVDNNPDVPDFLLRNKEKYRYLFDRDGEDAGYEDYWEVLDEAGERQD